MAKELDFEEYIRQGEPGRKEKAAIWRTAIGLQAVDGLKTSEYLKETARNLLLGEQWDLRNRYLHINPTEEWGVQPNLDTPTSTPTSSSTPTVSADCKGAGII